MINSQVRIYTISSIFNMMENGSISTPSFERGFVWNPELILSLFDSLNKGYPIGMILAVEGESDQFDPSPSEKSYFPESDLEKFNTWKTLWIMDGSQRLAALYSVLKGKQKTVELFYDLSEGEFFIEKADDGSINRLNMSSLFNATYFRRFQTYLSQQKNTEKLIDELHSIHKRFMNYEIPFQILADVTDTEFIDIFKKFNMSGVSLRREDIEKAKNYQRRTEEFDLNYVQPRIDLAKLYQRQGRHSEAENILLETLEIDPHQIQPRIDLAKLYQRQGRHSEAENILLETLEIDPHQIQPRFELSKFYQRQGKLEKAENILLETLEIDPRQLQPRFELSKIYQRQNKLEKAENILLGTLEIDPRQLQPRFELSKIYQRQNKLEKAENILLETLQIDPHQLHPRTELSKIYQRQNKLDRAEAVLIDLLELDNMNLQARTELSKVYQRQNKLEYAENILLGTLEIAPYQLYPRTELSKIYQHQNKLDKAEAILKESLSIDSRQLHPRTELARVYQRQNKLDEAELISEEVLSLDPINNQAISMLIDIWRMQKKAELCASRFLAFITQKRYRFGQHSQAPVFSFFLCCSDFGMKENADFIYKMFGSKLDDRNKKFYKEHFL